MPPKKTDQTAPPTPDNHRRNQFRRELTGMAIGIGLALMLGAGVPWLRDNLSLAYLIVWGAALGGIFSSLERFENAGAALTKKQNRVLNYAVGLGLPLIIIIAITWLL